MEKTFEIPQILEEVTGCEPVETGCCLRSCGGSPNHLDFAATDSELATKLSSIEE